MFSQLLQSSAANSTADHWKVIQQILVYDIETAVEERMKNLGNKKAGKE